MLRIRRARLIREARGKSVTEVAAATGISTAALSRFERCERPLSYDATDRLAAYFRVPAKKLREEVEVDASGKVIAGAQAQ